MIKLECKTKAIELI